MSGSAGQSPASRPPAASPSMVFEELLASALRRLDVDGMAGLDALCATHPDAAARLRSEVRRLRAAGLAGTLGAPSDPAPAATPARIGPYDVVRRLGMGGMGEVLLARQREPIDRLVAIKVIRAGFGDENVRARFMAERQTLSRMCHDGIARVFEAGETAAGAPYLVMEYVDGANLTDYCDRGSLPLRTRVELLCRVCDAVQHAHQNGVIHRDLKPTNVLVAEQDGGPVPKVIDFGLAKGLDPDAAHSGLTLTGQILGTPEYMSPEQADATEETLDTRTDVYALGVILYELLTGRRPFELGQGSLLTFLRSLRDDDPRRPSSRVARGDVGTAAVAARAARSARALGNALRGELDWIALRALAKARDERYASVSELAADLRRFLAGLPVLAGPPGAGYVLRRFVARHRLAVAFAVVVGGLLAATLVLQWRSWREIERRDARYDKLSLRQRLAELIARGNAVLRPRAAGGLHDLAALRAWIRDAESLIATKAAVTASLAAVVTGPVADARERTLRQSLADLEEELSAFEGPLGELGRARRRRQWVEQVEHATLREAEAAWRAAIASIADRTECPAYGGRQITPQLGLMPLRRNPASGLWEFSFWHPAGEPARWTATGQLDNPLTFDPVLVLVPGGRFVMGSPEGEEGAAGSEQPAHEVELEPFFIAKYELSIGQWFRWTGLRPSERPAAHAVGDAHPVTNIDWTTASTELWDFGLRLPSEAQWECAARGGTTTQWWIGADSESLQGKVNLADVRALWGRVTCPWYHRELDDGHAWSAPVDALAENPFGLHHVHGNVWEWCAGSFLGGYAGVRHRPGDGLIQNPVQPDPGPRNARGGSFKSSYLQARCAARLQRPVSAAAEECGLRPARPLVTVRPAGG